MNNTHLLMSCLSIEDSLAGNALASLSLSSLYFSPFAHLPPQLMHRKNSSHLFTVTWSTVGKITLLLNKYDLQSNPSCIVTITENMNTYRFEHTHIKLCWVCITGGWRQPEEQDASISKSLRKPITSWLHAIFIRNSAYYILFDFGESTKKCPYHLTF